MHVAIENLLETIIGNKIKDIHNIIEGIIFETYLVLRGRYRWSLNEIIAV